MTLIIVQMVKPLRKSQAFGGTRRSGNDGGHVLHSVHDTGKNITNIAQMLLFYDHGGIPCLGNGIRFTWREAHALVV